MERSRASRRGEKLATLRKLAAETRGSRSRRGRQRRTAIARDSERRRRYRGLERVLEVRRTGRVAALYNRTSRRSRRRRSAWTVFAARMSRGKRLENPSRRFESYLNVLANRQANRMRSPAAAAVPATAQYESRRDILVRPCEPTKVNRGASSREAGTIALEKLGDAGSPSATSRRRSALTRNCVALKGPVRVHDRAASSSNVELAACVRGRPRQPPERVELCGTPAARRGKRTMPSRRRAVSTACEARAGSRRWPASTWQTNWSPRGAGTTRCRSSRCSPSAEGLDRSERSSARPSSAARTKRCTDREGGAALPPTPSSTSG